MSNLPSKPTASTPSFPERAGHREWIGGRAITLLSHYWRDDDPVELTAAIGADWADVLEGLPQDAIQKACVKYLRDEPKRKPGPGAIYQLAKMFMPAPQVVYREPWPEPEREPPVTKERAAEILKAAGYRVNKFGSLSNG